MSVILVLVVGGMVVRTWMRLRFNNERLKAIYAERYRLARICPRCGYDVRAANKADASGKCPECGEQAFPPEF